MISLQQAPGLTHSLPPADVIFPSQTAFVEEMLETLTVVTDAFCTSLLSSFLQAYRSTIRNDTPIKKQ
jgi:hypothetical protein